MEVSQDSLAAVLKNKRICRFCMAQKEPLTNIYSKENRVNSSAPLPLQVMACVSIEVFSNDGMPSTICEKCRLLMEFCYKFKNMCKKADNTLRQFPLTGKWPDCLEIPKVPDLLSKKQTILNSIPVVKIEKEPESASFKQEVISIRTISAPKTPTKPKILNKSSVKILNKEANVNTEPVLSKPIITRNESGQVEIVTEILNDTTRLEEPDPVLSAEPIETNVFPCPNCERSFPLRQLLDIHMVNHNRERSFSCEMCDKRFFSKYDLGKHMLIHTGEKPYQCVVCKKAFTRSTLLHRHEKIHTDQPKFLCVFCEKPFLSKAELEKHTDRHKKNRPFPCKVCGKSFAFKQGLERHETIHAKDQPFPCQYCEMSFSTPSKLSRHLTAHAGERPFPCKLCPKAYLLSHHLTRHLRSHCQGAGSYKCYDCERTFGSRDDLIYHSAVHATQNLMCPLCKEQFENLDQVTEHIKQHAEGEQYACEFCDLIFLTAEKLQSHCEVEHLEDIEAYDRLDKINEKRGENYHPNDDDDGDGTQGAEEVLQEFIIEEYQDGDENVKEEKELQIEERAVEQLRATAKVISGQRILNKQHPKAAVRQPMQKAIVAKIEEEQETEHMEIEALDQKDGEDEDYKPDDDWTDDDENYEPPSKSVKITKTIQTRGKTAAVKNSEATSFGSRNNVTVFKVPTAESKMVQPSIKSVLQQIPKSVTVMKKEKTSTSTVPEKRPAVPPNKEVRILNEKVIRKADPIKPPPKTFRLSNLKTPVKLIDRKSTSLSPNENSPGRGGKTSPAAGPSKTPSPSSSLSPTDVKPTLRPSPPSQLKTIQQPQTDQKKLVVTTSDNRKVRVQKIVMTKAEVAAMAKEGKIEIKGGTMILKHNGKSLAGKVISKQSAAAVRSMK